MTKMHPRTTLAVLFIIISVVAWSAGYPVSALLFSVLSFFAGISEVAKFTSWYQFTVILLAASVTGIFLDVQSQQLHFPFMTIALLFAAAACLSRIVFFTTFSYTRFTWFESSLSAIALVFYLAGNLSVWYSWMAWAYPSAIILFSGFFAWGIVQDQNQLLANVRGGYKVKIGQQAEDFELPDQDGQLVKLSSFKGKRNILLIFVRGDWCPGCHMMLRTYEKNNEKFKSKNVLVMAIGPDPVGVNRGMVEKLGLDFKVLSDAQQRTAMLYGVQMKEYDNITAETYKEGIPLPASFLIDIDGLVRYVSRPDRVGEFLNPALIFPIVDQLK